MKFLPQGWTSLWSQAAKPADTDRRDRWAFFMLLTFILIVPWLGRTRLPAAPGGGETPVGGLVIPACAFAIGAVAFSSRSSFRSLRPLVVPVGCVVAVALLGVLQLAGLPDPAIQQIAPVNSQIYHETADLLSLYGRSAPSPRISITPGETLATVLRMLGYAVVLAAAVHLLRTRPRRRIFTATALVAGCLQVGFAAARVASGQAGWSGAFGNPGDFGDYLLVLFPVAFSALWAEILTNADRGRDTMDRGERLAQRLAPLAARVICLGVFASGIAFAGSASRIAAAGTAAVILLILAMRRAAAVRRSAVSAVAAGLVAWPLMAHVAGAQPLDVERIQAYAERAAAIWQASVEAWKLFPIVGAGLGAFPDAFRRVQPPELTGLVDSASSDVLQVLITGGAIGLALSLLGFLSMLIVLARRWRTQRHREESALALGAIGVLIAVGLGGLARFNLASPAVGAMLACALGLGFAAADGTAREPARATTATSES